MKFREEKRGGRRFQAGELRRGAPLALAVIMGALIAVCGVQIGSWIFAGGGPFGPGPAARVADERGAASRSVAVLPFVDQSASQDMQAFSDGLSEEVLDLLSRVPGLRVAARASAFSFKKAPADVGSIARQLQVGNVLEGSVRRSGDALHVTAALVRADTGSRLWSQTYDRKLGDIFQIQDEIAASVVQMLHISLLGGQPPRSPTASDVEAYTLYLQARTQQAHARSKSDWDRVGDMVQQAVRRDPDFAPAQALMARIYAAQAQLGYLPATAGWESARAAARAALALDPGLADAHTTMASILIRQDWNWAGAQEQIDAALRLDPGSVSALSWAGYLAQALGRVDRALEHDEAALAVDPLDPNKHILRAQVLYLKGRFVEAEDALRKGLAMDPTLPFAHWSLARIDLAKGDPAGALAELEAEPYEEIRLAGQAIAYHALGRQGESDNALAQLVLAYAAHDAANIAMVYAARGEVDEAFAWLERAYLERDSDCVFAKVEPLLQNLRGDARFGAFLQRMNLAAP
jgi:TolB-like protein/Flp pilus assembly protein TadD